MINVHCPKRRQQLLSHAQGLGAPFFSYDIAALRERLQGLQASTQGRGLRLFYACKANPLSRILITASNAGFGFDVASLGELEQVQSSASGTPTIVTGPAKTRGFMKTALERGADTIVLESLQQLKDLDAIGREEGRQIDALLRVQLSWEGEAGNVLGGDRITPFGLPPEEWRKFPFDKLSGVKIRGFHCFQWGNLLEVQQLHRIWTRIGAECCDLAKELGVPFEILDVGGGLGIPYSADDKELAWLDAVMALESLKNELGLNEIWLELGRYAVGLCGSYICRVIDRKTVGDHELLILEGGINHLLRTALTGSSFPCSLLRPSRAEARDFQLHGPLCTALDTQGSAALPADVQSGDFLQFQHCGAYGFTEAMPYFLCHPLAAEIAMDGGSVELLRAPQEARSYLC